MNIYISDEDDFNSFYVIEIGEHSGKKYFFTPRLFVHDIGLARHFNTLRSAKRSAKLCGIINYTIKKFTKE